MSHTSQKILHICAHYPPFLGGMEQVAWELATESARQGITTEVIASDIGYRADYIDFQDNNYTVRRLRALEIAQIPFMPTFLLRLIRQPEQSIYHVHIAQAFLPEIALLAARLRRGMFVAHFHLDVIPSGRFGWIFSLYKKYIFPIMLRGADAVIVFSKDQAMLVENKYAVQKNKIRIIPNGVSDAYFRTENRVPHTPLRLLFVGRLSPQKNISLLLAALDGISDSFKTTIVGDGELRQTLEHQATSLKLKNLSFAGRLNGDALHQAYEDADIFVLPSEREGMPLVLIDAMAMRLPAIGTDVLGIRDMIKDGTNGYLVPPNDPTALQSALTSLKGADATYTRMSQAAFESVQDLAWPRLVQRIIDEVYS